MHPTVRRAIVHLAVYCTALTGLLTISIVLELILLGKEQIHNPYMVFGFPLLGLAQDDKGTQLQRVKILAIVIPMAALTALHVAILDHYTLGCVQSIWDAPVGVLLIVPTFVAFEAFRRDEKTPSGTAIQPRG
jgi:hypothetical protein